MESFENNEFENEPEVSPEVPAEPVRDTTDDGAYHAAGTGRRESPYADSPYEMNHQARSNYSAQTPLTHKPHKQKKSHKPVWKGVLAVVLAVALVAGGCGITAALVNKRWETREQALTEKIDVLQKQITAASSSGKATLVPTDGSAMTPSQLYASCVDSVVAITSTVTSTGIYGNTSTGTSSGSGFILTDDGYIVTNYHVVEGSTAMTVTTYDGTEYEATLVGKDSTNDVAVLKVEGENMPAVTLGNSHDLAIGDMVAAIGNPLGKLAATQTIGYVSGINREVATGGVTTISMIQTDAAINPGNSGGPLFNMYGQVIGITTAKYSGTTGSGASIEGIGFAIPIDDVSAMFDDLIDYGYVTGAYMGVSVENVDEESASRYGLPTGAYVVSVEPDSAAEKAGIEVKDIITDVGGYSVSNITDLTRAMRNFKAGDTTTVTVTRSGKQVTLQITLDERPQDTEDQAQQDAAKNMPDSGSFDEWYDYFRRYFGG
ncbi:MAG: trypsin-like peptidase domain-containing protein [Eubacteriales bacterium]|nr:trypsin-like peptidase domain-containing protein [Eubacteriales bacterium]